MEGVRDAGINFCKRNENRLRGALIFFAIALAVCVVVGLGVHKSKEEGRSRRSAPAVVNHLPIMGM